jgi:hypothetical protein
MVRKPWVGSGTGAGILNIAYRPSSSGSTSGRITITASGLINVAGVNNAAAQNFS